MHSTSKSYTTTLGLAAIVASFAGLTAQAQTATNTDEVVKLEKFEVKEMKEFAEQAIVGVTPVAVTEVTKATIVDQLASRDIPFALENSPSFFVTNQGGGSGDSRIASRGFAQGNIAVLINGIPQNDNESGAVYWSNWDGLGDATRSVQFQRGLGFITLPSPAVGGTFNVITDAAEAERGASFKLEVGDWGAQKQSATYNTGLLANKFAMTFSAVRKKGSGYIDGTWYEGQSYYLNASYQINAKNRIEITGIAAPQQHGQNSYQQNIATYDQDFAKSLGYTPNQIALFPYQGRKYNQRYSSVSESYTGKQFYYGKTHPRQNAGSLNEVVNYYCKPVGGINWFSTLNENWKWNSVLYYSGGEGGGGGTTGTTIKKSGFGTAYPAPVNWDATIANNAASTTGSKGILYNNTNYQDGYGLVSKLSYQKNFWKVQTGVDLRYAEISHWEEIRDLLGGTYYIPSVTSWKRYTSTNKSIAATQPQLGLGDRFYYDYTSVIKWVGTFVQGQYERGPITAFATYGFSAAKFKSTNHMFFNDDGSERVLESKTFDGHQMKSGVQYKLTKNLSVFANAGYVTKIPLPTAAITSMQGTAGRIAEDIENETFTSGEAGVNASLLDNKLSLTAVYFYTQWRNYTKVSTNDSQTFTDGTTGQASIYQTGIDSNYAGLEIEAKYRPIQFIQFKAAASFDNWYYSDDGRREVINMSTGTIDSGKSSTFSLKGVKVGDAPQQKMTLSTTIFPMKGLSATLNVQNMQRYYAKYDPTSRTNDWGQSWQLPRYTLCNLHLNYRFQPYKKIEVTVFAHLLNALNKTYIQDATDNYFSASATGNADSHSAQRSEVYFGLPRTLNLGASVSF